MVVSSLSIVVTAFGIGTPAMSERRRSQRRRRQKGGGGNAENVMQFHIVPPGTERTHPVSTAGKESRRLEQCSRIVLTPLCAGNVHKAHQHGGRSCTVRRQREDRMRELRSLQDAGRVGDGEGLWISQPQSDRAAPEMFEMWCE